MEAGRKAITQDKRLRGSSVIDITEQNKHLRRCVWFEGRAYLYIL